MTKRQQRRERGRHRWLRYGRAIAGDALAEVLDRIARASVVVAEVLGRFGMAMGDYARSVGGVAAGSELINEMSTLDDLAFAFVDAPRGLSEPVPDARERFILGLAPESLLSLGLNRARCIPSRPWLSEPINLPRARCGSLGSLSYHFYPRCPWPPRHGTPSSFVEVCGDAAVGRVRTACDRCGFYSPPSLGKSLTCALHPLGRPEGRCGDWEDGATEAAEKARVEAEERSRAAYREAEEARLERIMRATTYEELAELYASRPARPSDRVLTHESVEVVTEAVYGADGMPTGRLITSRTRYRHYPDGRREIVPERPAP